MAIRGSCHCGKTAFEIAALPETVTRCTCSICSKRGALWAYMTPAEFKLLTDPADRATYRWRTKSVAHHFCATCGCGTYTESPDWSTGKADFDNPRIAVNARVLDDVDVEAIPVIVIDGKNGW